MVVTGDYLIRPSLCVQDSDPPDLELLNLTLPYSAFWANTRLASRSFMPRLLFFLPLLKSLEVLRVGEAQYISPACLGGSFLLIWLASGISHQC